MNVLDRITAANAKATAEAAEIVDLTSQVANLQTQVADLTAQLSASTNVKIDVSAVTPLLDTILGPDTPQA